MGAFVRIKNIIKMYAKIRTIRDWKEVSLDSKTFIIIIPIWKLQYYGYESAI